MYHADLALVMNGYKRSEYNFFPFNFGHLAVVLFFVLSGFLITYLLLNEKSQKEISVKSFYLKRILRIWPLYYLIVAASFLVLNNMPFLAWSDVTTAGALHMSNAVFVFLLVIICPNVVLLGVSSIGYANPTWSIGVEEQFYLIWPHIMKRRRPEIVIGVIIILGFMLSHNLLAVVSHMLVKADIIAANGTVFKIFFTLNRFFTYTYSFKIDSMAIGAAGAMLAHYRKHLLTAIFSPAFQVVFYGILLVAVFLLVDVLPYQVFSILFIILILNLALNQRSIVSLQNKVLEYPGTISYGIYLFHSITIIPSIKLVQYFAGGSTGFFTEVLICIVSLLMTILLASVSYKYFESYFLAMKDKLSNSKAILKQQVSASSQVLS